MDLIEVKHAIKTYQTGEDSFNALNDVSLNVKNIPQLNKLIDDMLTEANSQGLRSSEIGISQIKIPMNLDLR